MKRSHLPLRLKFRHQPGIQRRSRSREKPLASPASARLTVERDRVDSDRLATLAKMYASHCAAAGYSQRTIDTRQATSQRLERFLSERGYADRGSSELIEFAGSLRNNLNGEALRPWTVQTIYNHLRTFFKWLVDQKILDRSPHGNVPRPILRKDQIVPHTTEEIRLLLEAARDSYYPHRNSDRVLGS